MSVLDEPMLAEAPSAADREDAARERAERAVLESNRQAMAVDSGAFDAFLELLAIADADYIDAGGYVPESSEPALDWDAVSEALGESQELLIGVQNLLSATLAAMGVEDHQFIRVYSDTAGKMRLVSDHPRRQEIETVLNSPENLDLRTLYSAAMTGMSLAGGLVGTMAVPRELLEKVKARHPAA